jgi:hypothetical protein
MRSDLYGTQTFVIDEIPYLPHYNMKDKYVSPGYGKHNFNLFTESQLRAAGGKVKIEMLWERAW